MIFIILSDILREQIFRQTGVDLIKHISNITCYVNNECIIYIDIHYLAIDGFCKKKKKTKKAIVILAADL